MNRKAFYINTFNVTEKKKTQHKSKTRDTLLDLIEDEIQDVTSMKVEINSANDEKMYNSIQLFFLMLYEIF